MDISVVPTSARVRKPLKLLAFLAGVVGLLVGLHLVASVPYSLGGCDRCSAPPPWNLSNPYVFADDMYLFGGIALAFLGMATSIISLSDWW